MRNLITGLAIISLIWLMGLKANAQIEYTPLSPEVEIVCPSDTSGTNYYYLDLNQDNQVDFMIGAEHSYNTKLSQATLNEYMVFANSDSLCKVSTQAYNVGDTINANNFYSNWNVLSGIASGYGKIGSWTNDEEEESTTAFIGLKYFEDSTSFYGWVKLKVTPKFFMIMGYAWNKTANEQIIIGQTQ